MPILTREPSLPPPVAPATDMPQGVDASLSYLVPTELRPCSYACEPPPGVPWENCRYAPQVVRIADARRGPATSVQCEGFELWDAPSALRDFLDTEAVRATYYPEAAELALAATGARRAHVFDHLVRRREAGRPGLTFGRRATGGQAAANGRVHNDYSEASGLRRLALVLSDARERAEVARHAIVNIWRSIRGPVLDTPLAVCDARSVGAAELVSGEVRYAKRSGEIYLLTHSPRHRWSYYPAMDRHEALIFKQYDSQVSGVARFTPHAAFDHPQVPEGAPLRESIELRCLVVY